MDIVAAYRDLGSYRVVAALCGTTDKTVKRVVLRQREGPPPPRPPRAHNTAVAADVVGEVNNGGEMVGYVVTTLDPRVNFQPVWASRGKATRAEPVSALYARGVVHYVGFLPELEDELTTWVPGSAISPNRLDACVWACSGLYFTDEASADAYALLDDEDRVRRPRLEITRCNRGRVGILGQVTGRQSCGTGEVGNAMFSRARIHQLRRYAAPYLATLLLVAAIPAAFVPQATGLEFIALIAVAPDEPQIPDVSPTACTTPPPVRKSAFVHCYTPTEIRAAYGIDALHAEGLTGRGQTIVVIDSYGSPTALSDLQTFSTTFGLPAPDLTIIHPTGTPTFSNSMHGVQVGWAFETSLDLQWAHAIAPDAKLVLIAANPAETEGVQGFPSMFIGEQLAVNMFPGSVFSQSFAVTEQSFNAAAAVQVAKFDDVYRQAAANGITVLSSSGDSGTANIDKQGRLFPFPTAEWPSSDPLVTSAGGTWLQSGWRWNPGVTAATFNACLAGANFNTCAASFLSFTSGGRTEAVWKEDWLPAATGGARSALFTTPAYQSGISASLLAGRRGLPDLSWNAAVDGGVLVFTSFPGTRVGWHTVGGTSASAPQLAATIALANQLRHDNGKGPIGQLNPVLYTLTPGDFNDTIPLTFGTGAGVTTLNSNEQFGSGVSGMATTAGWDLTTGFGSPKAHAFVHDLAAAP